MTTTYPVPRRLHRRTALVIGLALVRWGVGRSDAVACIDVGRIDVGHADERHVGAAGIDMVRQEQIRRYHLDRQMRVERELLLSRSGVFVHSVM